MDSWNVIIPIVVPIVATVVIAGIMRLMVYLWDRKEIKQG
jgi:hypothetical protein